MSILKLRKAPGVLVKGEYTIFDDSGQIKDTLSVKADALILGDVSYPYEGFLTEMEILGAKIGGKNEKNVVKSLSYAKFNQFLEKLEKNGVKILGKRVMIEQNTNSVLIKGNIAIREEIGTIIPVEEQIINEFD